VIEFRVTSTFWRDKLQFIYGVPVVSGTTKRLSAKDYIKIETDRNQLPIEPTVGQQWKVVGDFTVTQVDRNQRLYNDIRFEYPDRLEIMLPQTDEGFIRFISNEIDNVSDEKARNLWTAFGRNVYDILKKEHKSQILSVQGFGETSTNSLIQGFKKFTNLRYCNWLAKYKVPLHVQRRVIKYHSDLTIKVIKNNPYELVTFGMSFKEVDHIALTQFNVSQETDTRLAASVRQAMTTLCQKRGHTYINNKKKLTEEIAGLVGLGFVDNALEAGKRLATYITFNQLPNNFHHHDRLLIETVVARHIFQLITKSPNTRGAHNKAYETALNELNYELTNKQKDAVRTSLYNYISLITGGAGTGKMTVTRVVLRAYAEMGYIITALALSGRAAMRLHESIRIPTSTIAKFLYQEPPLDDYDIEGNELKHIIVIYESSMVDIVCLYRIINHITPNCHLLFVGDPHQLPPIGLGLVLSELDNVDSIKKTHLDIVKRQEASSGIPEYSQSIRNGQIPSELTTGAIEFHNTESYETVVDLYCDNPDNSMVVAATKVSVDKINIQLQTRINSDSPEFSYQDKDGQWYSVSGSESRGQFASLHLRLNDPVIFIQNNYDAKYQNGSLGILTNIKQDNTSGTYGSVRLVANGDEINLTLPMLDHLRAAYAITLHKAQGSQFENCIVYLDRTPMIDRSWLYTAVTRSEEALHIVGTKDRFSKAVRTDSAFSQRNTHLSWLIEKYIALMVHKNDAA